MVPIKFFTISVLLVTLSVLGSLVLSVTAATSCYVCNSVSQPECGDESRISSLTQECTLMGQDRCLKILGPGNKVIRQCAGLGAPATETCLNNGDIKTCVCYGNYCNTGNRSRNSATSILVVVSGFILLFTVLKFSHH